MTSAISGLVEKFKHLFVNRDDVYYLQKSNGAYWCIKKPLTAFLIEQHLRGQITLGLPAIGPAGCKWLCWDDDRPGPERLNALIDWLEMLGFTGFIEGRRTIKAGHLWMFMEEPLPAHIAHRFGNLGKGLCGIERSLEFFPKQPKVGASGIGNQVRMPFGVHKKTGEFSLFIDAPHENHLEQLIWLSNQPRNTPGEIINFVDKFGKPEPESQQRKPNNSNSRENLLELIPANYPLKQTPGGEWIARCPVCAAEGHDAAGNNLCIAESGNALFCHYNNGEHGFSRIMTELRRIRSLCHENSPAAHIADNSPNLCR